MTIVRNVALAKPSQRILQMMTQHTWTSGQISQKNKRPLCKRFPTSHSATPSKKTVLVLSRNFQCKFLPSFPLFNAGDSWLPPGSQVKLCVDLPQGDLSRYLIISTKAGGDDSIDAVGPVRLELLELDFVYPTYRMKKDYSH